MAIASFGLTERQARFLATVTVHSGLFVGRQYAAFARITHGQKVHDFIEKLVARKFVTPIELGSTGRTKILHVHHKPLYAAIGEPDNRNRRRVTIGKKPNVTVRYFPDKLPIGYNADRYQHLFIYLARSPSPIDFRVFILRHLELLKA